MQRHGQVYAPALPVTCSPRLVRVSDAWRWRWSTPRSRPSELQARYAVPGMDRKAQTDQHAAAGLEAVRMTAHRDNAVIRQKDSDDRVDEGFSTRAIACGIGWVCVWPALTNLSGRKPRVLGAVYGERGLPAGSATATDALVWVMKTDASTLCRRIWPGFDPNRIRDAPFARLLRSLRTRWLGRFGRSNR